MKKTFYILLTLIVLSFAAFITFPSILIKYNPVEKRLQERLESMQGGSLAYEDVSYSFFPFFEIRLKGASVQNSLFKEADLRTDDVYIRVARLPLLIGRLSLAQIRVEDASLVLSVPSKSGSVEQIAFTHVDWSLGPVGRSKTAHMSLRADYQQTENALKGSGTLRFAPGGDINWESMGMNLGFEFKPLPMQVFRGLIHDFLNVDCVNGVWWGTWGLQKETGSPEVNVQTGLQFSKFAYRLRGEGGPVSPEFDASLTANADWNNTAERLTLHKATLTMPVGTFDLNGDFLLPTGELEGVRFAASNIILENIPQYFIHLKDAIPFNIGFSGRSQLEMSLSGTWDHLSIHANWDLNSALLTYARYFSKAKDIPANVMMEFLLKDHKLLSGDFSVHLKDATFKGTLTDMDTESGYGQINIITNKFSLATWETIIPPFQNYQFAGQAKFLANLKGNLQKLYDTQAMFNVSIQDGFIKSPDGHELKDLKLALDVSPLSLDIRNSQFVIGDSLINADLVVYNLNEHPLVEMEVKSDAVDLAKSYAVMQNFFSNWLNDERNARIAEIGSRINYLLPEGQKLENLKFKLSYQDGIWTVADSSVDAYLGDVDFNGSLSVGDDGVSYQWDTSIQRLSLNRFYGRSGAAGPLMDGNLFLKMNFRGENDDLSKWLQNLSGSGTFLITNGRLHTLSAVKAFRDLSQIAPLIAVADDDGTSFDDVRAAFTLSGEKILTEELTVVSKDFGARGQGEAGLDGSLNFRLDAFLTEAALQPDFGQKMRQEGHSEIGPLPFLLTGPLTRPNLKPDPSLTAGKLQRLIDFSNQKMGLRNFYSEDRLFKRS